MKLLKIFLWGRLVQIQEQININGIINFVLSIVFMAELWRSDGTEAGTKIVTDLNPGPNSSNPFTIDY